ncbi:DUF4417 domain-containing protein [Clostridium hydrogeniformans]|uniref:DUF4417 domain-containing protein n=1 Tax=Clostridium hydrogeniformans TaxID=349933 RepID=UPI0004865AF4|nr:DUF4417 domain-containing protein [Clostridium hydrogeniformans]
MNSLCKRDCNKCTHIKRCGGCSLCEAAICNNVCFKCGILCPRRGASIIYLNKIYKYNDKLKDNKILKLPYHIPIIPDKLSRILDKKISPLVGIHGGNIFSSNGEKIRRLYREKGFKEALNIEGDGILQFYVKDRTLEGIWDNRNNIYKELKEQKFKAIIAPNFSVYEDCPRFDHLYNIQRSLTIYNELIEEGFDAIPDISWYNINDLDFWINLINNSSCNTIAFSFQVVDVRLKASNNWKNYLSGFSYLCKNLKNIKQIIIIGASSLSRVLDIKYFINDNISIHVLNQSAYIQSQRGMYSNMRVRDIITPKDILLEKNIKYFNEIYENIND